MLVYLILWPSVGRGLRLEVCISGQEDVFRANLRCLLNCKAFGGSMGSDLEDVSRGKKMHIEQTCVVYLIVRPSVSRELRLEDVSRVKKMYFEQTCAVHLVVRPSVGRGLRLEDVSRGKKHLC